MISKNALIIFALCAALFSVALAQEETQCRGKPLKFTDHQKAQIAECLELAGIKTIWKIPPNKLACFGVCILEKKDLMTPDGKINHEKSLKYIDAVMPDEYKKELIDGVDKCIKEHGDKVKGKDDPTCMTFMDVGQCVHDVFLDVCVD